MLKGIKKLILLIILLIPFMVIADENYKTSIDYANSYIDGFSEYQNYILFPESGYYYDETLKNDNFTHGGFLSRKEYLITNYDNKSYLSPGVQYWTLTPGLSDNAKRYVIDYTDKEYEKTNMSGVRVTEFILPKTRVNGNGTRSNPWYFLPKYKVILSSSDYKKGGISDKLGSGCNNSSQILTTSVYEDESIDVQLCPNGGYEYYNTDCSINISKLINTHMIRVSNVKRNLSCKINFVVSVYKILLDTNGGSKIDTKELYLSPGKYWFKEKDDRITETQITKIDKLPTKTGYTFKGFYIDKTSDTKLIDEKGNIVSKEGYTTDGTMYARYTANEYKITFDQQLGTGGTPSVTATYDSAMPTISVPTRAGYKFNGYYSEENGKGTKYYDAKGEGVKKWNIASDTTLYAYWTPNKLNIVFNANGATIKNEVELDGIKYYWKLDTNGNIMRSKDKINYTESFYSKNYTSNIDLPNYNYSKYIKLTKTGYTALLGKEWCTNPDGSGKCFNQSVDYSAKDICPDIVFGDCNITLYTNWELDNTKYNCIYDGELKQGVEYVNGQYTYRYMQDGAYSSDYANIWKNNASIDGWGVQLTNKESTESVTSELCTTINGKSIASMSYMFAGSQATTIDLTSFDTSKVTNMSAMFRDSQATTLNLSNFNTSNVITMSYMFSHSQATIIKGLENFNTSQVTYMHHMFNSSQAKTLDLSSFNTSNVTDMSYMFSHSQATIIKGLENFNTSKVTNMSAMFRDSQATTLNLSSFNTSSVTDMHSMFDRSQTKTLDLSSFNTSNVTDMSWMFCGSKATTLNLSSFNTSNVTNMLTMFWNSQATIIKGLENFNTSKVTNMSNMFCGTQVTTLDLSSFDTSKVIVMSHMFNNSKATTIKGLEKFNTSNVTDMSYMFCKSQATTLDLSSFDTSKVTDMSWMFYGSQATKGYARTQTDADRFNANVTEKPSGLKFVVK